MVLCCSTENRTAANITAGHPCLLQGAQRAVPTLDADYQLRRGCCAAAVWATAARFSAILSRVLMMTSTAGNKTTGFERL